MAACVLLAQAIPSASAADLTYGEARIALIRAETGRAQVAYEFVVALATLLEVSGQAAGFSDFLQRADVTL